MAQITLAQINPTVGDIDGNIALIKREWMRAEEQGSDLVVFSEMCVTAYPVGDLVLRQAFRHAAMDAMSELATWSAKLQCDAFIGGLWEVEGKPANSVFWLSGGEIRYRQDKVALPNYGVFDEKRHFKAGDPAFVIDWRNYRLGLFVCEDMWDADIARHIASQKPDIYISMNGSPYEAGKSDRRAQTARSVLVHHAAPLIYTNQVGGQDDLVFDGSSYIMDATGKKITRLNRFIEDRKTVELTRDERGDAILQLLQNDVMPVRMNAEETLYQAAMLGVRDYVHKSGFTDVLIALSGGIDSALTAAIAVDALGAEHVHCVYLPSPYSSAESTEDAQQCADMLGVKLETIDIQPAMKVMETTLAPHFAGRSADVTEENIQSRLRGNIIMALSNKMGWLVLTTGNKSEVAVGYCTLYGDMCGAFNPLIDMYKTSVFALSKWRNQSLPSHQPLGTEGQVMPQRIITKAPSAELRPDQKDEDSLPPYEQLDQVLQMLIENELSMVEITAQGYDEEMVRHVAKLLYGAEYKRRQAAPGVKVSQMAFGLDRRYPIVNRFRA